MNIEAAFMRRSFPVPPIDAWYESYELPAGWSLIADKLPGASVLGIGSASGWVEWRARKAGARVIATDIFETYAHKSLPFVLCQKERLPFADNTFDMVLTSNVLHHGDLEATVGAVRRVLKPNGVFMSFIEPCIPRSVDEQAYLAEHCAVELASGIAERRPTFERYVWAMQGNFRLLALMEMNTLVMRYLEESLEYHGGLCLWGVK